VLGFRREAVPPECLDAPPGDTLEQKVFDRLGERHDVGHLGVDLRSRGESCTLRSGPRISKGSVAMTQMRLRPRSTVGIDRAWSRLTRDVDSEKAVTAESMGIGSALKVCRQARRPSAS
jgi:hypothetical protein